MSNMPISMNKLKNIIGLYCQGTGIKPISAMSHTSRNTVKKYIRKWDTLHLSYQEFMSKSDKELSLLFSVEEKSSEVNERASTLENLLPAICKRLKKKGVTALMLHKEYLKDYPDGYGITQFRLSVQCYLKLSHPVMRQQHKAGDKLFIDYAGDKLSLYHPDGTEQKVEVFVAILGCSQLTYVEAVASQKKEDFIKACENAFYYIGGVPQAIVPDNLKAAVTKGGRYQSVLNEEFASFAEHYGTTVYPARVYKPRDKALVENAVKLTYKDIYTKIEGLHCSDLDTLNLSIRSALEGHNNRPLTAKGYSRREYFEEIERETLSCLNPMRYSIKKHVMATVGKDAHVRLADDVHYYSVPYVNIGKKVKLTYTADRVDIYQGYELIASHQRDRSRYDYTTNDSHLAPQHRFIREWSPEKFIEQAKLIDSQVEDYIQKVLEKTTYREQAYKFCTGILSLAHKVSPERLAAACRLADTIGEYNYLTIEDILNKKLDLIEQERAVSQIPEHTNVRGKEYYQ
jgi:transposase